MKGMRRLLKWLAFDDYGNAVKVWGANRNEAWAEAEKHLKISNIARIKGARYIPKESNEQIHPSHL